MLRTLKRPGGPEDLQQTFAIAMGGLGTDTAEEGLAVLDGVPASMIGQPYGPIPLDENGLLPLSFTGHLFKSQSTVDGDSNIEPNETKEWYLTAYDSFLTYDIEAVAGVVSRNRNVITYTAGDVPGMGGFIINGRRVDVVINGSAVLPPTIEAPVNNAVERETALTIVSSAFHYIGFASTHLHSDWELSTDEDFTVLVASSYDDAVYMTEWPVSGLLSNTHYYARCRHTGTGLGDSDWGPTSVFKTRIENGVPPAIMSPSSGTIGLSDSQTFTVSAFVPVNESIQVPQKNASGDVIGYVAGQKSVTLVGTVWELSKTNDFAVIDKTMTTSPGVYSWMATGLQANTSYYLRARYDCDFKQPLYADYAGMVQYEITRKAGTWSYPSVYATKVAFSPATPWITSPGNGTTGVGQSIGLYSSSFAGVAGDWHAASDWQLATDPSFSNVIAAAYGDSVNKTGWTVGSLSPNVAYYARVRHYGGAGGYSAWSNAIYFATMPSFAPYAPTIVNPAYGSLDRVGDGGFRYVTTSEFSSPFAENFYAYQLEASLYSDFSIVPNVFSDNTAHTVNLKATQPHWWAIQGYSSEPRIPVYLRIRYMGTRGIWSPWTQWLVYIDGNGGA